MEPSFPKEGVLPVLKFTASSSPVFSLQTHNVGKCVFSRTPGFGNSERAVYAMESYEIESSWPVVIWIDALLTTRRTQM
jgi:hypothetical protein